MGLLKPGLGGGGRVVPFIFSATSTGSSDGAEGELSPLDSPEKGSSLSIHPNLHVLEPGQTKGKCELTEGSTGPSPFGDLD